VTVCLPVFSYVAMVCGVGTPSCWRRRQTFVTVPGRAYNILWLWCGVVPPVVSSKPPPGGDATSKISSIFPMIPAILLRVRTRQIFIFS
jgi:hypothetical protein